MKRRRPDPKQAAVDALISEIKDVNDVAKFHPDPYERERLLAEKSALQSELLRQHGELFMVVPEGKGTVCIMGREDDRDACHAVVANLDPDVRQWVKAQTKRR